MGNVEEYQADRKQIDYQQNKKNNFDPKILSGDELVVRYAAAMFSVGTVIGKENRNLIQEGFHITFKSG